MEGKVPIPKALCYTVSSQVSVFYEWMSKHQTQVPICTPNGPLPVTTHPSKGPYPNSLGAWVCEFAFDEFSLVPPSFCNLHIWISRFGKCIYTYIHKF
jgi:hypothetical protein